MGEAGVIALVIIAAWTAFSVIAGLLIGRWLKVCSSDPALSPARNDPGQRRKLAATDALPSIGTPNKACGGHSLSGDAA